MMAVLLALALASLDPCADAAPECRAEAKNAIITWRTAYELERAKVEALEAKLAVRTATGSAAIAQAATVPPPEEPDLLLPIAVSGLTGVIVGAVVVGLFVR